MSPKGSNILVRNTQEKDFPQIIELSRAVYPDSIPWSEAALGSHVKIFPEGQFVAIDQDKHRVVGMASSLILLWEDYEIIEDWSDFTDGGKFTNHDPEHGRTLYGAEVMVHPQCQGQGIGRKIYAARRDLARRRGLLRIRAGARLRGYHEYAKQMSAKEYVKRVVREEIRDPTLSFQLHQGFEVLGVVPKYLQNDPESLGFAAVIEWLNPEVAKPEDYVKRNPEFLRPETLKRLGLS